MAISIFETRSMAAAMRQEKKSGRFLLDLLFSRVETHDSETVDIDIVKGKRRMAPFQTPRVEGKLVEKLGFVTNSYKPAYVNPKKVLEAADIVEDRGAGQNVYSMTTPQERAVMKLAEELNELEDMISRREEWMCAQQLVNGYVDVVGDGVNYRIDLNMEANHKVILAGTDVWTDSAATPNKDLAAWARLISKDAGVSANTLIGNSLTIGTYLEHPAVKDSLNTRRIDLGLIKPEDLGDGVSYFGQIAVDGKVLDVYSYDEWYVDTDGNEQNMLPDGQIVLTSTKADFRRHYGAIKDKKAGYVAMPRFPKTWEQEDPSMEFLMVQSAPLPAAHQIDAIVTAKVF